MQIAERCSRCTLLILSFIKSWNPMFLIRAYLSSCSLGGKEGNVAKKGNLESGSRFSWFDWNPHPKSHNISYCRQWREGIESQQVLCLPFYAIKLSFQHYGSLFLLLSVFFFSIGEQAFTEIRFPCDCHKASYSSSQLLQVYYFPFHLIQYWFLEIFLGSFASWQFSSGIHFALPR